MLLQHLLPEPTWVWLLALMFLAQQAVAHQEHGLLVLQEVLLHQQILLVVVLEQYLIKPHLAQLQCLLLEHLVKFFNQMVLLHLVGQRHQRGFPTWFISLQTLHGLSQLALQKFKLQFMVLAVVLLAVVRIHPLEMAVVAE
jgi:hypothetical protein